MRKKTDMTLDYPTAWAIQNEVGPTLKHDPRCSSVEGPKSLGGPGFLCDCGAVEGEWERRCAEADVRAAGCDPYDPDSHDWQYKGESHTPDGRTKYYECSRCGAQDSS